MATAEFVHLRVRHSLVPPIETLAGLPPTRHLYLLEGKFSDIGRYAGTTVDWIIKVAHLICDPRGTGQLYTHTTGTASDWYHLDRVSSWRQVSPGDLLVPGIYEFESTRSVSLSKISARDTHSVIAPGSQDAVNFSRAIRLRDDAKCVVNNTSMSLFTTHLIPKRIGSDGAKDIVDRFSGAQAAVGIDRFDPRIGILLSPAMEPLVVHFRLGFYHVAGDTYALHNFHPTFPDLLISGHPFIPLLGDLPPLHRYLVTLSARDRRVPFPPRGVFDCTTCTYDDSDDEDNEYLDDDEDDEYTTRDEYKQYMSNDKTEPPYSSPHFDRFLREQAERQLALEHDEEIARWSSGIQSDLEGSTDVD